MTSADQDELAWAACEMFLATGDQAFIRSCISWFDPSDPATWRWGWWHMSECYGHAIRSYAFAAQSGRLTAGQLDATFLAKCQAEIVAAGDAYATARKKALTAPVSRRQPRLSAAPAGISPPTRPSTSPSLTNSTRSRITWTPLLANMNYEGGCNPVNVSYVTGLGWKRQREIVSQWHSARPQ